MEKKNFYQQDKLPILTTRGEQTIKDETITVYDNNSSPIHHAQKQYYPPPNAAPSFPHKAPESPSINKEKKSSAPWILVLLLVAIILSSGAYVSGLTNYYESRLEEKNTVTEELSTENEELKSENENLTEKNIELGIENLVLILNNSVQNSKNANLEKENAEFKAWLNARGALNREKYGHWFLTPDDEDVKSTMKEILGNDADGALSWDDRRKLDRWVYDNIEYNHDTPLAYPDWTGEDARKECWLFPNETLKYRRGDCEDHALLALSMFYAEEVTAAWAASVTFEDNSRHMVIFINVVDDQMSILDPTNSWENYFSGSEPDKLEQYGDHWGMDVIEVNYIFNQSTFKSFATLQEFYDYF